MEYLQLVVGLVNTVGFSNTLVLLLVTAVIGAVGFIMWVMYKTVPPAVERLVSSVERLGENLDKLCTKFEVHDERGILLQRGLETLTLEVKTMQTNALSRTSLDRVHERIDVLTKDMVTSDDLQALSDQLARHNEECQHRNERVIDKVV